MVVLNGQVMRIVETLGRSVKTSELNFCVTLCFTT